MSTATNSSNLEKPRLLVVDDSRVMRKAIGKLVRAEFDVTEAEDGEMGWERLLEDNQIQVVIADVLMPRLDGYSLICRIRAADESRIRDVPVIVITGAEDEETRVRAFACGANDFITKPIDGAQLLECARAQAKLDQTGRKLAQASAQLAEQASIDPLTQFNSRRLFVQRAQQDLAAAKRRDDELSLIRLDVDNLKPIYSEYGDDTGDRVLVWLAKIITEQTRAEDTLARIAGGTFAIITPTAGRLDGAIMCERLRSAINAQPFQHANTEIAITASIGLVTFGRDPGSTIDDLLVLAETRVAAAKAAGGNRLSASELAEGDGGETVIVEQPDISTALEMIARGDAGRLEPYLLELALQVLPLFELANSKYDLELDFELGAFKERLSQMK
ncbi:MAG: diguanylate cyclase [Acidiferrobacterales bacterium]